MKKQTTAQKMQLVIAKLEAVKGVMLTLESMGNTAGAAICVREMRRLLDEADRLQGKR
jgi:hypothetical protein